MPYRHRLLLISFIESFAMILLERGLYFYTHARLGFGEAANLSLALLFGLAYFGGALLSHRLAHRLGEKSALVLTVGGLMGLHLLMTATPHVVVLVVGFPLVALVTGLKWPIVESYIGAGQSPRQILRQLGRFNVAWAAAVPLAVAISGPIIASSAPWLLFAGAAALNVVSLWLIRPLPGQPTHWPHDHPERPPAEQLRRYGSLLSSSRWAVLSCHALLLLLAPLLPGIFMGLGLSVTQATNGASLMDLIRLVAFVALGYVTAWHGRAAPLVVTILAMPVGFVLIVFTGSLPMVLLGELIFGAAAGLTYYAALYYAMVVKNGSVDAGGGHEGLMGLGFALGPMMGLIGLGVDGLLSEQVPGVPGGMGMLLIVVPMMVLCTIAGLRPLRRAAMWASLTART